MNLSSRGVGSRDAVNKLHTTFKNSEWPPHFINQDNVLEYFCHPANAFYDNASCNQQIKMQNINRPLDECLINMNGIQYVLWTAQPPLYVICKHRRNSPTNVTPMAYYYVINGVVYQAPDLYTFIQSRLISTIEPLKKAFDEVLSYSRYNVAKGYYWEFKDKPVDLEEKKKEAMLYGPATNFQQQRSAMLLKLLAQEFPNLDRRPTGDTAAPSTSQQSLEDDTRSVQNEGSQKQTSGPSGSNMNPPPNMPKKK